MKDMKKIQELTKKLRELKNSNEKARNVKSLLLDTNKDIVVQLGDKQITFNKDLSIEQIINELIQ